MNTVAPSHDLASRAPLVRGGAALGAAVLGAVGFLLATRRIAGAFSAELPPMALVLSAAIAAALLFCGRIAWRSAGPAAASGNERLAEHFLGWAGSAALVLLAVGCSDFSRTLDWVVWLPLITADQCQRQWFLHEPWLRIAAGRQQPVVPQRRDDSTIEVAAAEPDELVLQQLLRVRDAEGVETLRGMARAEFAAGQRHAILHVGFCPPLAQLPTVEAEPVAGPDAQVKVVKALAHGARLEVRLATAAAQPCCVEVDWSAAPAEPDADYGNG